MENACRKRQAFLLCSEASPGSQTVFFDIVQQDVHGGEGQADDRIGTAVVDGDSTGCGIAQRGTGESHVVFNKETGVNLEA